MKVMLWLSSLAMCLAAQATEQALVAHGGTWAARDGAVWVEGGPGPKLVATGSDFADGEAGVEVFFDDARPGNAGLIVRVSEATLEQRPRMDMPDAKPLPYPQGFGGLFTGFAGP